MADKDAEGFGAWLGCTAEQNEALRDRLVADCEAPGGLKRVRQSTVLEYRCAAKRCLLLLVWRMPGGLVFYQPSYRLASDFNTEHSNEAGRAANTLDGDRIWKAQAGVLDGRYRDLPNGGGLQLHCGHVQMLAAGNALLDAAEAATPGRPTRRFV